MVVGPITNNDLSIVAGVQNQLRDTWKQEKPVFKKLQSLLIKWIDQKYLRKATYVWKNAHPAVKSWAYGEPRTLQSFSDRQLTLNKVPYELSIPWSLFDEEDDQLGDLMQHVQQSVTRYLQLPDELYSEYFNGVPGLNPSLLPSYDGAGLFSDVDGSGNARGGVVGGNILVGSGVSVAGMVNDFTRAQQRFIDFRDPAGKPVFSPEQCDFKNLEVIIPSSLNKIAQQAADSKSIKIDETLLTSEGNFVMGRFTWRILSYLTNIKNFYVVLKHNYYKPFIAVNLSDIVSVIANINNSDLARQYNLGIFYSHLRTVMAPWFTLSIIKISN